MSMKRPLTGIIAVAVLAFSATSHGQIKQEIGSQAIVWNTSLSYQSAILKVAGPNGFRFQQNFEPGETLSFDFSATAQAGWQDGAYDFKLTLVPDRLVSGKDAELIDRLRQLGEDTSFAAPDALSSATGRFSVLAGQVQDPTLVEGARQKDQVFVDDLITQGSQCVGLDCVNGESFGFDTIRLKENNLRIHFQDTSVSASFPTNDWRIVANDTGNGGANYLAFEDSDAGTQPFRVDAGAGNAALRVSSSGQVGIGEDTPIVELHVSDGDSPTLRLEQDGSSGFTPQTWDIAGNEANFFVRDVTNGSRLPFKIKPSAPTDSLVLDADGDIGIGTSSPASGSGADLFAEIRQTAGSTSFTLDYAGANKFGELTFEESNTPVWSAGAVANNDYFYIFNYGRSRNDLVLNNANGNLGLAGADNPQNPIEHSNGAVLTQAGVWQDASSRALKKDIAPITSDSAMSTLADLVPVRFRYVADPTDEVIGFIAEDVPDMVATASRKTLSSMDIVAVLTKVVQEQQKTVEQQDAALKALRTELDQLKLRQSEIDQQ